MAAGQKLPSTVLVNHNSREGSETSPSLTQMAQVMAHLRPSVNGNKFEVYELAKIL